MQQPIHLLEKELDLLRFLSQTTRSSQKKREAKELIPQFERAIEILKKELVPE